MTPITQWPWGLFLLAGLIGGVALAAIYRLRRSLDAGRPLPPLSPATFEIFGGVSAEAPREFRGFAWKFTLTFALIGLAVLFLSPFLLGGFGGIVHLIGAVAAWPRPPPPVAGPDYVFLLFLALFLSLTIAAGLEFEEVRSNAWERVRPLAYLAVYVPAASVLDVGIAASGLNPVYSLIPRAVLGGGIYTLALFSCLTRPRPLIVAPLRRERRTILAFVGCMAASLVTAVLIVVALYPWWLSTANPYLRVAFFLLIPSLAYTAFGAYGLLLYLAIDRRERKRRPSLEEFHPPVSIIIPAYNEEGTIAETLARVDLAAREYPGPVEIVVGNDGSRDRTSEVARAAIRQLKHAVGTVVDLPHGGKSSALNGALLRATGEIVFRIDADTPVYSFARIVPYFHDPDMGEVQGRILPLRRTGWIARFRLTEVMWVHAYTRRALIATGTVQVISGNFCAFRRDRLLAAGGWVPWNGEDAEISLRMLRLGYKLRFELDSLAYEDTPETLPKLLKQRIRWNRGGYFSHAYHYGALFGALECGALSLYWWLALAVRGARKYLTLVFAAALSLTLSPFDLYRVLILLFLMLVPRMVVILAFLVKWGFWRQVGWALIWPLVWFLRSYFWLESLGTMLPGTTPEFSD